jgi:hypothetical protein
MRLAAPLGLCVVVLATSACDDDKQQHDTSAPSASASVQAKTPDRLAPGELAEGDYDLYGLKVPAKMKLEGKYQKFGRALGRVRPEDLSNYVRERVAVAHVEIAAERTIFPKARIKAGDPNRVYRIEVIPQGKGARLLVRDVTKPKAPKGLSQAEMRRRAGLTPDGKQLDPKNQE